MPLRDRVYDFCISSLEALGILEAWDAVSLWVSELKDSATETLDELFGERDWRPILARAAHGGLIACSVLGLVGGALLMANLLRSLELPRPHLALPQLHFELPSLRLDLDFLKHLQSASSGATKPTPAVTPRPTATPAYYVVANTAGQGVYIRASTVMTDRVKAWPEGTLMVQVGPDGEGDGRAWKNVRAPDGTVGWIPAQFLSPAPAPTATPTPTVTRTLARTATPTAARQ